MQSSFFDRFGKEGQAIKNITYSYISHILTLYYGEIDLLYMELMLVEKFEKIYDSGKLFFQTDDLSLKGYKQHLSSNQSFRKLMEEFLDLLNNPNFYDKQNHFAERIQTYMLPYPGRE